MDAQAVRTGISQTQLMQRAGDAAWAVLQARWPAAQRIGVWCGPGNNGGDGYVLASCARAAGKTVAVMAPRVAPPAGGAGALARDAYLAAGGELSDAPPGALDVRVDAVFGIGLSRAPHGELAQMIAQLCAPGAPVLALDLPSGLDADTGVATGAAVRADATVTFIARKQGLHTGMAVDHTGEVICADLDLPQAVRESGAASAGLIDFASLRRRNLPPRARAAHKGDSGHVLVVGGDTGYGGAVRLAGEAALRCGAGLVSVATRPGHVAPLLAARPELMVRGVESLTDLAPLLDGATAVVIGPGLGRESWGRMLLEAVFASDLPMVVDADALNLLAQAPQRRAQWVLTPHAGEAGRLLGSSAAAVNADRYGAVHALVARYGGVALLKGPGTLVWDGHGPVGVCPHGGPALAAGGMGDVLSGVIGALLAQQVPALPAAALGACLHGAAADALAGARGERGLLAGELCAALPGVVNARPDAAL